MVGYSLSWKETLSPKTFDSIDGDDAEKTVLGYREPNERMDERTHSQLWSMCTETLGVVPKSAQFRQPASGYLQIPKILTRRRY